MGAVGIGAARIARTARKAIDAAVTDRVGWIRVCEPYAAAPAPYRIARIGVGDTAAAAAALAGGVRGVGIGHACATTLARRIGGIGIGNASPSAACVGGIAIIRPSRLRARRP